MNPERIRRRGLQAHVKAQSEALHKALGELKRLREAVIDFASGHIGLKDLLTIATLTKPRGDA